MKFKKLTIASLFMALMVAMPFHINAAPKGKQMYYEIKVFRFNSPAQAEATDNYLKNAFIPALHRAGINSIGVFKPVEKDTAYGKMTYVFIPYKTYDEYFKLVETLEKDQTYNQAGKAFLDADVKAAPFTRYESIFMKAFAFMPEMKTYKYDTKPADRIYELRSYESATEAKALKKISMFNEGGEMKIFEAIGSNPVFYGQVLLGSQKPRLMYLTTYADMKSHDDHWTAFREHPDWKKLSGMEEYKNTTSKTKAFLCHPTDYSDF
ncbi:MAG TPA: NIPSNAP family protein [Bacteroidales bacterium]|nr:NIPSNAP family protein [Bacteroidales bacterium]